ncbi:hypothetical protein B0H14DRAFT_3775428 [Mycena olivaceomarginata]|nr:hypothetical protein B0H14DRAFT_3775428 [Mycena olivaceomarginata]
MLVCVAFWIHTQVLSSPSIPLHERYKSLNRFIGYLFMPHVLVKRLRAFLSLHPERKLPPDIPSASEPGDADPPHQNSYDTVANEARRQQQLALSDEPDHVHPIVITSAQGTHSLRVGSNGIPFSHGMGINAELTVNNRVQHGHMQYTFHPAEPGWGLDVPLVSADQVRSALHTTGSMISPVTNDYIMATFPVTSSPESADSSPSSFGPNLSQVFTSPQFNTQQANYSGIQAPSTQKVNIFVDTSLTAIGLGTAMESTLSSESPECDIKVPHSPCYCPTEIYAASSSLNRHDSGVVGLKFASSNQVRIFWSLVNGLIKCFKGPDLQETYYEWKHRVIADLYDPTVPPSETKKLFATEFERADKQKIWPYPPSDSIWASLDSPNPACKRCYMQQQHLLEFCPSSPTDTSRIHPPVTPFNAFEQRPLPDKARQSPARESLASVRPGTPYPHLPGFTEVLQSDFPPPPVMKYRRELDAIPQGPVQVYSTLLRGINSDTIGSAVYASQLTEETSYGQNAPMPVPAPQPRYSLRSGKVYPIIHPLVTPPTPPEPDSPRNSPDFSQFLDEQCLDALFDAHHKLSIGEVKYPDISTLGPEAYYSEPDSDGIRVLRLPTIDRVVTMLQESFNYTPLAAQNAFNLPGCELFFSEILLTLNSATTRGPFKPPRELQHYPERRSSSLPTQPYPDRPGFLAYDHANNLHWMVAFAAYLDEVVCNNIWAVQRAISATGGDAYPDLSDTSNHTYFEETLDNGSQELRIPALDNLVDTLHFQWGYTLFSEHNLISLPSSESFFRELFVCWDYLPRLINRSEFETQVPTLESAFSHAPFGHIPYELWPMESFPTADRGPFTAPLDSTTHPEYPLIGSLVLGIPNKTYSRQIVPAAYIADDLDSHMHLHFYTFLVLQLC